MPEQVAVGDLDGGLYAELAFRAVDVTHSRSNLHPQAMTIYASIDHSAANNLSHQAEDNGHEDIEQSDVVQFVQN